MKHTIALYNEYDPKKAAWLRELIKQNVIAPGVVDERSILDIRPDELAGYTQVHLCAGIGIWSYALRLAGWPDDRPVWTVSEPCQPHSAAGKMLGDADERYIRPAIHHAISLGKRSHIPVYGEQVANGDGLAWLDTLSADMAAEDHTVRAFDLCSAGFGSPHIRQRLFWVAVANDARRERDGLQPLFGGWDRSGAQLRPAGSGAIVRMDDAERDRWRQVWDGDHGRDERDEPFANLRDGIVANAASDGRRDEQAIIGSDGTGMGTGESRREPCAVGFEGVMGHTTGRGRRECGHEAWAGCGRHLDGAIGSSSGVADTDGGNAGAERQQRSGQQRQQQENGGAFALAHPGSGGSAERLSEPQQWQKGVAGIYDDGDGQQLRNAPAPRSPRPGATNGFWQDADWISCRDGKWRPVRPGTFPLVNGASARVLRLRGYGDGINAQQAAHFIKITSDLVI